MNTSNWLIPKLTDKPGEITNVTMTILEPPHDKKIADEGYRACSDRKKLIADNPYVKFSADYWSWRKGWLEYWEKSN